MQHADALKVRQPTLSGSQPVEALWFPAERFSEPERAGLILAHWQAGASAWRFAEGDLLRLPTARTQLCESLAGWPLVRQGRTLCSAPLTAEERKRVEAADICLVRGGRADALYLRDATALAPSQWVDIGQYALLDTYDCRDVLPEAFEPEAVKVDIREILGDAIAPANPEREQVMRALLERQAIADKAEAAGSASRNGSSAQGDGASRYSLPNLIAIGLAIAFYALHEYRTGRRAPASSSAAPLSPLHPASAAPTPLDASSMLVSALISVVVLTVLLMGLRALLNRRPAAKGAKPGAGPAGRAAPHVPPRASDSPAPSSRWRRWFARLAERTRLSRLYGKRQAAYLQHMLRLFESGDLHEALRHALPLGDDQPPQGPAFGTPGRRDDLALSLRPSSGLGMALGPDLQEHLKKVYRQSFERLDREGRVEEAVFVLAELLKARQEALDYLEKHQRFRQAAELSLAWDMPAAMIVRLLCLAEDWQRALQVARRDNAFADAVLLLESKQPDAASRLRLEWAQALTDKGRWLQAVEVIWALPEQRERAVQWLLAAEATGGSLAIGALVKRAALLPDTLSRYEAWIDKLRNDPERHAERATLAQELLAHKANHSPELASLAAASVRAIVCDQVSAPSPLSLNQLQALVKMSRDKLLQADLPSSGLPRHTPNSALEHRRDPLPLTPPEAGHRPIFDAVPLADGRYLLALGEAGALVIESTGQPAFHFPVPTQRIVIGHSRQVALALANRGEVWRICKLDLVNRSASDLGVLRLDAFASLFDGSAWTIARGRTVRRVDVDRRFETLWHVDDLPGHVAHLHDDLHNETLVLRTGQETELWHYRLPQRRLLGREPAPARAFPDGWQVFNAIGQAVELRLKRSEGAETLLEVGKAGASNGYRLPGLVEEGAGLPRVHCDGAWLIASYVTGSATAGWQFIHRGRNQLCATLSWPFEQAQFRCVDDQWLVFDHQGRLLHINPATSEAHSVAVR